MSPDERWLAANWPFVRAWLPAVPARVAEVGCGPLGGFVPMMQAAGYHATGIDPQAPPGPAYRQALVEDHAVPGPLDAMVACTSLHHVAGLGAVLDLMAQALVPGGRVVIVEWVHERFDEATARWCFARLPAPGADPGWLHRRQAEWRQSGQRWDAFLQSWAGAERLHAGQDILGELDARFDRQAIAWGPYFFPDLAGTSDADEQAAIDSGLIQPTRIQYAGQRRSRPPQPQPDCPCPPHLPATVTVSFRKLQARGSKQGASNQSHRSRPLTGSRRRWRPELVRVLSAIRDPCW